MIDILSIAPTAAYKSGKLRNEFTMTNAVSLDWNGDASDPNGFAKPLPNAHCEDGNHYPALQMHPKWVSNGTIRAMMPAREMPVKATFKAKVGFLRGVAGTDGVTFEVWEHHSIGGRMLSNRLLVHHKLPDGRMDDIVVDLSYIEALGASLELRVNAGGSSGRDWAVWANPKVVTGTQKSSRIWAFEPKTLTVIKRNETSGPRGKGDEPYLGAIYFRAVFGKPESTRVKVMTDFKKLGSNIRAGESVNVPVSAGLRVADVATNMGVGIMGVMFAAFEEDNRGSGRFKDFLKIGRAHV